MIRVAVAAAAVLLAGVLAGCKYQSFNDAPVIRDNQLRAMERTDLDYVQAPVDRVVEDMKTKFRCRIEVSAKAGEFIRAGGVEITAQVRNLPVELAFKVLQAELEFNGLVLIDKGNALGRPAYYLDRSLTRELTVPATAAKAPPRGGADF